MTDWIANLPLGLIFQLSVVGALATSGITYVMVKRRHPEVLKGMDTRDVRFTSPSTAIALMSYTWSFQWVRLHDTPVRLVLLASVLFELSVLGALLLATVVASSR